MKMNKKKGVIGIGDIPRVALFIGIAIFVVSLMAQLLGNLQDQQTANSAEYNVTAEGITGLATFGDWWVIMVLAVILIIIIGLLYALLGGNRGGGY